MRILVWIAAMLGMATLGAAVAAAQYQEQTEEPAHEVIVANESFELRVYKPMIVAEVTIQGEQMRARRAGFRRLAAYIFAQDRPGIDEGEKIAMTSPVMQDQKIAMTSPVMQDGGQSPADEDAWRTRFVMPSQYTLDTLPQAPADITLTEVPTRQIAAVRFNGFGQPRDLDRMEISLRTWIREQGYQITGPVEYAFYDGPWVPGAYRRNEVMLPVERAATSD